MSCFGHNPHGGKPWRWRILVVALAFLLLAAGSLWLHGCGHARAAHAPAIAAPPAAAIAATAPGSDVDALRLLTRWVAGLATLAMFASVAAAIVLPFGRKAAATWAAACFAIVTLALGFNRALPWLPWVGLPVIVGVAGWLVWQAVILKRAALFAADHGDRVENAARLIGGAQAETMLADVKAASAQLQDRAGVRRVIAALRGRAAAAKAGA